MNINKHTVSPMIDQSNLIIRLVKKSDLPALEWDGEFIHFRNLFADTYRRMESGDSLMWVAEQKPIGIIGQLFVSFLSSRAEMSNGSNRAYIYGFRVRQKHRNQGVGSTLLGFVEKDLRLRGYSQVTLNVARENTKALKLYERNGYRIMGYEPGIWSYINHLGQRCEVREPAWRMEKVLLP